MKMPSTTVKSQSTPRVEKCYLESCSNSEVEDEPPGKTAIFKNLDEEPPSTGAQRRRFFGQIPSSLWSDWKWHFRNRITSVDQLTKFIPLTPEEQAQIRLVIKRYPLSVTPYYLSLVNPDDPEDPVRKQVIPSFYEIALAGIGSEDPLEERRDSVVPGLVHRYPDRVLIVLTDICPVLCRHCTRKREWHNGGWVRTPREIEAMLDYIRQNKNIRDVIISGGDPLTLSTQHLEDIISRIRRIPHVEIIRIGTGFPWYCPSA